MLIAVVDHTGGKLSDEKAQEVNRQIAHDFQPHWHMSAELRLARRTGNCRRRSVRSAEGILSATLRTVFFPIAHELTTLVEQVATPIRGLGLVANRVRERHLCELARCVHLLGRPVSKRTPETVHGERVAPHPT